MKLECILLLCLFGGALCRLRGGNGRMWVNLGRPSGDTELQITFAIKQVLMTCIVSKAAMHVTYM